MQATLENTPAQFGIKVDSRAADHRCERRYAIPPGMRLKIQMSPEEQPAEAELRDISRSGVGLMLQRVIAPGTSVTFPFGSQVIFAQVRYCYPAGGGFAAGVLIREILAENGAVYPTLDA